MVMKDQRVSLKCSQVLGLSRLFVCSGDVVGKQKGMMNDGRE